MIKMKTNEHDYYSDLANLIGLLKILIIQVKYLQIGFMKKK